MQRYNLAEIDEAVDVRERGDAETAILALEQISVSCSERSEWEDAAAALGELIICFKHMFQRTQVVMWLEKMCESAKRGLGLDIPRSKKAPFYLRMGDYFILAEDLQSAEWYYRTAYSLVARTKDEAEYAGHLAEYLALRGQLVEAAGLVRSALRLLESRFADFDLKHYLVIRSGLYARKVGIELAAGDRRAALESFVQGYAMAWQLALYHQYPVRRQQYHRAILNKLLRRG